MGSPQYRIGAFSALAFLFLAIIIDCVQVFLVLLNVFPGLGVVFTLLLSTASAFGFWLAFTLAGVDYIGGRRWAMKSMTALAGVAAEIVPLISVLPMTTVTVGTIILATRAEDRERAGEEAAIASQQAQLRQMQEERMMAEAANENAAAAEEAA